MKLHVTPQLMELSYELLRATPPFRGWRLPHADNVQFVVTGNAVTAGYCRSTYNRDFPGQWVHEIGMSSKMVKRTHNVLEVMAHEMVHEYCDRRGVKGHHGAEFQKRCGQVAKYHGFNPMQL